MLSDDLTGLAHQARLRIRDPEGLALVLDRMDDVARQIRAIENSAEVRTPAPPDNVVRLSDRHGARRG